MKIEIDGEDLLTLCVTAILIVALFTVPGCYKAVKAAETQEKTHP